MRTIRNILYQFKCYSEYLFNTYWTNADSNTKSALIGVFGALLVVFIQKIQQDRKENEQQNITEQNKLKYLHFLILDSYKVISFYDWSASGIIKSNQTNPFVIEDLGGYVPHSLNTIANKINQEEYYLLAVRQTKNENVAEVFQMYNSLNDRFNKSIEHYMYEFSKLIDDKDNYETALNDLFESVNQYLIENSSKNRKLIGVEKDIYNGINNLMGYIIVTKNTYQTRNVWLRDSREIYVDPLIAILNPHGQVTHRKLMLQAIKVSEQYKSYLSRKRNVVEAVKANQRDMNRLIDSIKVVSKPINEYVLKLKL